MLTAVAAAFKLRWILHHEVHEEHEAFFRSCVAKKCVPALRRILNP